MKTITLDEHQREMIASALIHLAAQCEYRAKVFPLQAELLIEGAAERYALADYVSAPRTRTDLLSTFTATVARTQPGTPVADKRAGGTAGPGALTPAILPGGDIQ